MRERIDRVMPLVREHLVTAQRAQQRLYNRPAQAWKFQPGTDRVLVPTAASKFLASWQGPYTVGWVQLPIRFTSQEEDG